MTYILSCETVKSNYDILARATFLGSWVKPITVHNLYKPSHLVEAQCHRVAYMSVTSISISHLECFASRRTVTNHTYFTPNVHAFSGTTFCHILQILNAGSRERPLHSVPHLIPLYWNKSHTYIGYVHLKYCWMFWYTYTHICTYIHTYTHQYTCICTCTCTHAYIYTHIRTYIHISNPANVKVIVCDIAL